MSAVAVQPGLHHPVGDNGAQNRDQKGGDGKKEIVAHDLYFIVRVDDGYGGLGDAGQQGIQCADQQIGGEAPGDSRESCGQTCQRMAAAGPEDQSTQGQQDHISGIGGDVGHDAQKDQHGSQKFPRGDAHKPLEQGIDHTGLLCHADPQHGHQHHAQGGISGKIPDGAGEHAGKALPGQQADNGYSGIGQPAIGNQLAGGADIQSIAEGGDQNDRQGKQGKQNHGMGQGVADALNTAETAVVEALLWILGHGITPLLRISHCRKEKGRPNGRPTNSLYQTAG